jgi:hypothetical protein
MGPIESIPSVYFPELMEIGQHLKLKLFFTSGSEMNTIEMLVRGVWMDIHLRRIGEIFGPERGLLIVLRRTWTG